MLSSARLARQIPPSRPAGCLGSAWLGSARLGGISLRVNWRGERRADISSSYRQRLAVAVVVLVQVPTDGV